MKPQSALRNAWGKPEHLSIFINNLLCAFVV